MQSQGSSAPTTQAQPQVHQAPQPSSTAHEEDDLPF